MQKSRIVDIKASPMPRRYLVEGELPLSYPKISHMLTRPARDLDARIHICSLGLPKISRHSDLQPRGLFPY